MSLVVPALLLPLLACGASDKEPGQDVANLHEARGVGDTCANGVFGTPNWPCADGLVCVFESGSSEPQGPDGSSSASTGICQEPGGDVGDTCADGTFGTPNLPCADGLVCVFESGSSEPQGPDGSSSASTGTCQEPGGDVGDTCADGTFGTPNLPCADGLVCVFESGSSEPQGPDGSSSASTGTCQEPGGDVGDTCADGTFGTPNLPCADGLVCDFGESTEPEGPDGSSSASTGVCVEP